MIVPSAVAVAVRLDGRAGTAGVVADTVAEYAELPKAFVARTRK